MFMPHFTAQAKNKAAALCQFTRVWVVEDSRGDRPGGALGHGDNGCDSPNLQRLEISWPSIGALVREGRHDATMG